MESSKENTRALIKEIAQELALAMHQSKDKEVSGLFVDINNKLKVNDSQNEKIRETQLTINLKLDAMNEKIDVIFPVVTRDMNDKDFWERFWTKVRVGGNGLTWLVGIIAAILILSGQAKAILLAWLASRTF